MSSTPIDKETTLNIESIRKDFPILSQKVHGYTLAYFDNAATTQKPQCVIDTIVDYYTRLNSNIHRGVHYLSEQSTNLYEEARQTIQKFINAQYAQEIIFTSGTTASINAIAFSFGERYIMPGDEIIISTMEHHANIVPWQMLCERKGAVLKVIPINQKGEIIFEEYKRLLSPKTKLVSITHVSNVLGTINPISEIINVAHQNNIPVLIDGAQSIQHIPIDVQKLDCDFFVFSGHKIYGPTGIGVLFGKEKWLNDLPPYQGGGDMVDCVTFEKTTYNDLPLKFEEGTTNYVGAIGLAKAIQYISNIGINKIANYELQLLNYATEKLSKIDRIKFIGNSPHKGPVISFIIEGIHPYDTGMILDKLGIAVRTGTHCAQPLMDFFDTEGTVRVSLAFYNTFEEIDRLVFGIKKVIELFN